MGWRREWKSRLSRPTRWRSSMCRCIVSAAGTGLSGPKPVMARPGCGSASGQRLEQALRDGFNVPCAVDAGKNGLVPVEVRYRRGLFFVDLHAIAHHLFGIVGATFLAGASGNAFDQLLFIHNQLKHAVQRLV